ncbi:alpha/beta hydrolase [Paenibacillus sp. FSL H7-0326]|uniref:alpha/beta fold hydrolase n=1 Tax=Paenibacillus sp. FSL H7-0326 TaxID=1921144 RepID=UPI00096FC935|nr:alpha/beta hydrolase [Paenibacillus sp. FSL H7-0326]OMC66176.1 alpha/beta hydrolase [Paenibacillus sp. FSL H7-0326]
MIKHSQEKVGFVFINGAGLEGLVWSKVVEAFEHPFLLAEYPQRKGSVESRNGLTLENYVTEMKKQVDGWGPHKIVIVAHSLGGALALKLASLLTDRLAGIVAVGAVIPKRGGSFLSALPFPQRVIMSIMLRTIGTKPPESIIQSGLCNDLPADQAAIIVRGFIPESRRVYSDRVNVPVPSVPKLFVKLTKDKELSSSLQDKMISNFAPQAVRSLDTGHLPMISNPEGLRSILVEFLSNELRCSRIPKRE